jgi:hypothetical protein
MRLEKSLLRACFVENKTTEEQRKRGRERERESDGEMKKKGKKLGGRRLRDKKSLEPRNM